MTKALTAIHDGDFEAATEDENKLLVDIKRQAILRAQAIIRMHVSAERSLSAELIAERRMSQS
jgi:hypothetical protein